MSSTLAKGLFYSYLFFSVSACKDDETNGLLFHLK